MRLRALLQKRACCQRIEARFSILGLGLLRDSFTLNSEPSVDFEDRGCLRDRGVVTAESQYVYPSDERHYLSGTCLSSLALQSHRVWPSVTNIFFSFLTSDLIFVRSIPSSLAAPQLAHTKRHPPTRKLSNPRPNALPRLRLLPLRTRPHPHHPKRLHKKPRACHPRPQLEHPPDLERAYRRHCQILAQLGRPLLCLSRRRQHHFR